MSLIPIRLILSDVRSAYNVGAILRTADATGVERVYACGYTPYPTQVDDERPPHVASANTQSIAKSALGAEQNVPVTHHQTTTDAIQEAQDDGFHVIALEQSPTSTDLYSLKLTNPTALVVGNEVTGLSQQTLDMAQVIAELPMIGYKESLNVAVSAGIALYHLRFGG